MTAERKEKKKDGLFPLFKTQQLIYFFEDTLNNEWV